MPRARRAPFKAYNANLCMLPDRTPMQTRWFQTCYAAVGAAAGDVGAYLWAMPCGRGTRAGTADQRLLHLLRRRCPSRL